MAGPMLPAARALDADLARCPGCGFGDLFTIEIARRQGSVWRGVYCAGEYDRDRRRFLRRSCGYAEAVGEAGQASKMPRERTLSAGGWERGRAS